MLHDGIPLENSLNYCELDFILSCTKLSVHSDISFDNFQTKTQQIYKSKKSEIIFSSCRSESTRRDPAQENRGFHAAEHALSVHQSVCT